MELMLVVGWASTAVLALMGLRGLRRSWELDRLREARLSRLEAGYAELGVTARLAEVHELRRDRRHLRGLVAIPAVAFAHMLRPRTAAALTALALGAGAMGAIQPDGERRSGRVPVYAARQFSLVEDPPAGGRPLRLLPAAPVAETRPVERGAGAGSDAVTRPSAAPQATTPEPSPDPDPTTTVPSDTSTAVDPEVTLLNEGCVADVGLFGIEAEIAC